MSSTGSRSRARTIASTAATSQPDEHRADDRPDEVAGDLRRRGRGGERRDRDRQRDERRGVVDEALLLEQGRHPARQPQPAAERGGATASGGATTAPSASAAASGHARQHQPGDPADDDGGEHDEHHRQRHDAGLVVPEVEQRRAHRGRVEQRREQRVQDQVRVQADLRRVGQERRRGADDHQHQRCRPPEPVAQRRDQADGDHEGHELGDHLHVDVPMDDDPPSAAERLSAGASSSRPAPVRPARARAARPGAQSGRPAPGPRRTRSAA